MHTGEFMRLNNSEENDGLTNSSAMLELISEAISSSLNPASGSSSRSCTISVAGFVSIYV